MSEERLLREQAALLEHGFATSLVPQFLLDPGGRILLASEGAGVLVGLSTAELVGEPLSRFLGQLPDLQRRQPDGPESRLPVEMEVQRLTGDRIPVEMHLNTFGESPDRLHCLLVVHDISNARFLDQERAARLDKLSLLNQVNEALYGAHLTLDQVLEAILICVTAGQCLGFNRAFLLLIDEHEKALRGEIAIGPSNREEASRIWQDLEGQQAGLYEMMTSYDRSIKQTDAVVNEIVKEMSVPLAAGDHALIQAMQRRQALRVTAEDQTPGADSIRGWLNYPAFAVAPLATRRGPLGVILADNAITGGPICNLDLEILQLFANESANAIENSRLYFELEKRLVELRKVTQRQKEDQETLLRMERLSVMGETSAMVAHELRNPLVAIGGFARSLLRSLDDKDPNHRFASIITEEVTRLERIIHDLLDFIRPQKLRRKSVVGDELIAETVRHFQEKATEQSVKLILDLRAAGVLVNVNPGEIQQVLQNLVLNALQVVAEVGGTVMVRTQVLAGGLQIEVLDDGPGFADDMAEKIFTPFFTTKVSGSGLGLTICYQIVKAHGGVLSARSRRAGGAAFSFILPLPKLHLAGGGNNPEIQ